MAPFQYQSSNDPRLTGTIADLMLRGPAARAAAAERIGEIQARGAQQEAGAWSGAATNIGQMIGALPGQIALGKRAQLQDSISALQLRGATQAADDDQRLRSAYQQAGGDPGQMRAILASSGGLTLQHDQTLQAMEQQQADRHQALTSQIGLTLHDRLRPDDPANNLMAMQDALNTAEQHKLITSEQAQQFGALASADPSKIPDVAKSWAGMTAAGRAEIEKTITAKPGEVVTSRWDNKPVGTPLPEKTKFQSKTALLDGEPRELSFDEGNGKYFYNGEDVTGRVQPVTSQEPKAEQDKRKYLDIATKKNLGQPLTPEEQAFAKGYETEKTLGVDKSAGAAADRQTAALGAQTAQQKRAQDFAALQAARTDLEKNVNTPYNTAKTSANTLRDVVEAAKNGNTVAASLQALEGTMAAIRAQGLNRINTAEIGATANAGSLFQNIAGWIGKKAEGQPVPASVQKDMLEFADILEKAAYKKYQAGHKAVNALYNTNIPELLTGPEGAPLAAAPTLTPGLAGLAGRK